MTSSVLRIGFMGVFMTLLAASALAEGKATTKAASCVDVQSEASFASVGYDHIVTLKNGCKKAMTCTVKTNVNPDPATLDLDPNEQKSVVTWRGSPAREFTPEVSCSERSAAK